MREILGIVGDSLLIVVLWLAALLQVAMLRDWSIRDTRLGESYRLLLVAGLIGLAARLTFSMIDNGRLTIPFQSALALSLVALGVIGLSLDRLSTKPRTADGERRRESDWMPLGRPETERFK